MKRILLVPALVAVVTLGQTAHAGLTVYTQPFTIGSSSPLSYAFGFKTSSSAASWTLNDFQMQFMVWDSAYNLAAQTLAMSLYQDNGSGRPGSLIGTVNGTATTGMVSAGLGRYNYWTEAFNLSGISATVTGGNNFWCSIKNTGADSSLNLLSDSTSKATFAAGWESLGSFNGTSIAKGYTPEGTLTATANTNLAAVPEVTSSFTTLGLITSGLLLRRRTRNLR